MFIHCCSYSFGDLFWSLFSNAVLRALSIAILSLAKRELVALFIVFLLLRGIYCFVSLPHTAVGWYMVFDC